MKRIAHIGLLAFIFHFSFFIFGCEKIIDISEDPSKQQLVLNAVPIAGQRAFVYFAHTRFFLDASNDQPFDEPATVTLYVNGTPYTPDSVAYCKYFFPYTYAEGDSLEVVATVGDRVAHARTYIPKTPTFSNVQLVNNAFGSTFRYYLADFDFQDHADEREYYSLAVAVRDSGVRYNEWEQRFDTVDTVHVSYFMLRSNPEITGDASYTVPMLGYLYTRNLFNDGAIDGRNYHVAMRILNLIDTNEVQPFKHEYTVSLESLTFARLRYLIDVSRQGGGFSFFAEQGQVRGNVEGAQGIFAGCARSKIVFWPDTLAVSKKALEPLPEEVRRALK